MGMASEMLSPQGRLGPKAFLKNGLILLAIGFVIGLLPLVSLSLSMAGGLVGLILIWPWIAIWVKRLHDADLSGWLVLLVIIIYLIVVWLAQSIVTSMVAPGLGDVAGGTTDFTAVWSAMNEASRAAALPNAVCTLAIGLIFLFGANAILKGDPGENQYGPPQTA